MVDQDDDGVEDKEMEQEKRENRGSTRFGQRDLPIYNGREYSTRFIARYPLACRANNEDALEYGE